MSTYSYIPATEFNFPNITIYRTIRNEDNVQTNWRANANEGYVMHDPADNGIRHDPETGEEIVVYGYCRVAYMPLNFNFDNFPYTAVLESELPENSEIFSVGDGDHETA